MNSLLKLVDINRLDIDYHQMSTNTFIEILILLQNVNMIRITSLCSPSELFMLNENKIFLKIFLNSNKITKLTLMNTCARDRIDFILQIFPHLQSFAIEIIDNDIFEPIIKFILTKIKEKNIRNFTACCFLTIDAANDQFEKFTEKLYFIS
ncbi:hypothetical protein I4U23_024175 [Adineta vaga]|nr:hypothetical protein I4U23_024175 [Adineta vaga]